MALSTTKGKVILITGCSNGGIGSALALHYASLSPKNHVFATVRTPSKATVLQSSNNISILPLDVTSQSSVAACLESVEAHGSYDPSHGLDVLINNAGLGLPHTPLIDVSLDSVKSVFETNVFGLLAVTQAFASPLIKAKGVVVNIASVGGILNTPFLGPYSASKAAVATLSETLRVELAPLGVRVLTAMVGVVETRFQDNLVGGAGEKLVVLDDESPYKELEDRLNLESGPRRGKMETRQMGLEVFARRLVGDVEAGRRGVVRRGTLASFLPWLKAFLPTGVLDYLLGREVGLNLMWKSARA